MMLIRLQCPQCATKLKIDSRRVRPGGRGKCPECGEIIHFPKEPKEPPGPGVPRAKPQKPPDGPKDPAAAGTRPDKGTSLCDRYEGFFRDYAPKFQETVTTHLRPLLDSPRTPALPRFEADLWCNRVIQAETGEGGASLKDLFSEVVRESWDADIALTRASTRMVADFADHVDGRAGAIDDIANLVDTIKIHQEILGDVYFHVACEPNVPLPDMDPTREDHVTLLTSFQQYETWDKNGEQDYELECSTFFRGIPVDFDVTVHSAEASALVLNVHPYLAAALSRLGYATLRSSLHDSRFRAYAGAVDLQSKTVTFTHLVAAEGPADRREHIRVEPGAAISVELRNETEVFRGRLIDISTAAFAVYGRDLPEGSLGKGTEYRARLSLPLRDDAPPLDLEFPAKVERLVSKLAGDPRARKVVFLIESNAAVEARLSEYISHRQSEIISELHRIADEISET